MLDLRRKGWVHVLNVGKGGTKKYLPAFLKEIKGRRKVFIPCATFVDGEWEGRVGQRDISHEENEGGREKETRIPLGCYMGRGEGRGRGRRKGGMANLRRRLLPHFGTLLS